MSDLRPPPAEITARRKRRDELSQELAELRRARDLETRAEEKLRLDDVIREREARLAEAEDALRPVELVEKAEKERDRDEVEAEVRRLEAEGASAPPRLFYSYAHEDEPLRDELAKHLKLLERQGVLSSWHDRGIEPGADWDREINRHLLEADIILLLVSADFMASDYIWGRELEVALERHEKGEARVIPILLRPTDWAAAPFRHLQALPRDARPVTSWDDRDEAFADIARAPSRGGVETLSQRLNRTENLISWISRRLPYLQNNSCCSLT